MQAIQQAPVPESHKATVTPGAAVASIAVSLLYIIEQSRAVSSQQKERQLHVGHKEVEAYRQNKAFQAIRQSPIPMMERSTISSAVPAVGNVATINQTEIPESQVASTIEGVKVANIAVGFAMYGIDCAILACSHTWTRTRTCSASDR